jgi:hypothetical protein
MGKTKGFIEPKGSRRVGGGMGGWVDGRMGGWVGGRMGGRYVR